MHAEGQHSHNWLEWPSSNGRLRVWSPLHLVSWCCCTQWIYPMWNISELSCIDFGRCEIFGSHMFATSWLQATKLFGKRSSPTHRCRVCARVELHAGRSSLVVFEVCKLRWKRQNRTKSNAEVKRSWLKLCCCVPALIDFVLEVWCQRMSLRK